MSDVDDRTTEITRQICRCCLRVTDRATSVIKAEQPKPGDFNVCLYCGHLAVFGDNGLLREMTKEEEEAANAQEVVTRLVQAIRDIQKPDVKRLN